MNDINGGNLTGVLTRLMDFNCSCISELKVTTGMGRPRAMLTCPHHEEHLQC